MPAQEKSVQIPRCSKMDGGSTSGLPALPEQRIVVGCGGLCTDFLASVAAFPQPDEKIRSTELKVQGGGNVGNALTGSARLGLCPRIISKVANDAPGKEILAELEADGIDTSYIMATRRQLPILVDAERKRKGLDELLTMANYVVCSAKFPQAWTEVPSIASALLAMALRLPRLKFVIVTLGESGCIMLERNIQGSSEGEQTDVNILLESLKQKVKGTDSTLPIAVSSEVRRLEAPGIGIVSGRLFVGTAEDIPPSELIDTTGAGDAFIGAVLYALSASMPPEKMLTFAGRVAAAGCRALGARTGLPHRNDPRLIPYL